MSRSHRALVFFLAALLTISCGSKRSRVTPAKSLTGSVASKLSSRLPSAEPDRRPHSQEDASSSGVASTQPIDKPSSDTASGTTSPTSPSWSVTTIRTLESPSTSSVQHQYPRPKLSSRVAFPMSGRSSLTFLAIVAAAAALLSVLLVRRRTPG